MVRVKLYRGCGVTRVRGVPGRAGVAFRCNLCGRLGGLEGDDLTCGACGATVEARHVVFHVSRLLFGSAIALTEFPISPEIVGVGPISALEPYFDYAAAVDDLHAGAHFLIDAYRLLQAPPPLEAAYAALHDALQPGGLLLLTLPLADSASEYYPGLYRYRIVSLGEDDVVLVNRTAQGVLEVFDGLRLPQGQSGAPELRRLSLRAVLVGLESAGFVEVAAHDKAQPDWGIFAPCPLITARRRV